MHPRIAMVTRFDGRNSALAEAFAGEGKLVRKALQVPYRAVRALFWYATWPPTMVYTTSVDGISSSGMVRMSRDSTVISASLPGCRDPLMSSSNAAYAFDMV